MGPEGYYLLQKHATSKHGRLTIGACEALASVNEKNIVKQVLNDALGDMEVGTGGWRQSAGGRKGFSKLMKPRKSHMSPHGGRSREEEPPDVLTVKDKITVEGPEHLKIIYGRLRATAKGFI